MAAPHKEREPVPRFRMVFLPWIICFLAALFYCYDFLLRVTPSIMIHPLMNAYGVNAGQIGLLSAFYYYAYTPLQLPAGVIVDKYSPRIVLFLACLLCTIGAFLFGITEHYFLAAFARILMGIGSAFAFVGALKLAAIWLPDKRFALFAGLTSMLGTLGAVFADNILSYMVFDFGWQETVLITGFIGLVLTVLLFLVVRDKCPYSKPASESFHSLNRVFERLLVLIRQPYTWINGIIGALLFLPISVFASLWGVDFLARKYAIHDAHAASAVSLVFIGTAIAAPLVGAISERMQSQRIPLFIGSLGCLICAFLLIYTPGIPLYGAFVLLFLLGIFTGPQILVFSIAKDLSPPRATGMATAMANFIVTIGAALFQPLIGYVLDYRWDGARTDMATPLFSISDYRFAFALLMLSLLVCLFLIFLLPPYQAKQNNAAMKGNS